MTDTQNPGANRRFVLGAAGGLLVGGLIVAGALSLVPPRSAGLASPRPSASASTVTKTATAPSSGAASPSETMLTPVTSLSPGASPVVTSLPSGSYVTLFNWLLKTEYTAVDAANLAASKSKNGYTVVAIDTDTVDVNKPGRYGIGVVGAKSLSDTRAVCEGLGLPGNDNQVCWGRRVR